MTLGTGDGLYVYRSACANLRKFFIGIDANSRPLEKLSEKIYRKPSKGGLSNLLFVQSSVEDLPSELNGIASELVVNFPWGSLLQTVAGGDEAALSNLRRICLPGSSLKVLVGVDYEKDRAELARLHLPLLTLEYLDSTLTQHYLKAGFAIVERKIAGSSGWPIETSWARRLKGNTNRSVIHFRAIAIERRN